MKATSLLLQALACAAGLVLLGAPAGSAAQSIPGYPDNILQFDRRELAKLPPYCIHTAHFRESIPGGMDADRARPWQQLFGEVFQTLHHYCWGLMYLHRAKFLARDDRTRRWNFSVAIHEFDYVLNFVNAREMFDFVLLPEILTRRGEALLGLDRPISAIPEFERAMKLRPDYWLPYALLADHYVEVGEVAAARGILEAGLANAPEAKGLVRRLSELGGPGSRGEDLSRAK